MNRKIFWSTMAFILAFLVWGLLPAETALAEITGITMDYWPTHVPVDANSPCTGGGGTAYAIRVTVSGTPGQKVRLQVRQAGDACTWDPGTSAWIAGNVSFNNYPLFEISPGGTLSTWLFARGFALSPISTLGARAYACDSAGLNCTFNSSVGNSNLEPITKMDLTTSGGWLEETDSTSRSNRAVVVRSTAGGSIIGLYVAEPNGVGEGYAYTDGGFKVSVPGCDPCGYTIETWDLASPGAPVPGTQVNTMGVDGCPNTVTVGAITSLDTCGTPTVIQLISFTGTTESGSALLVGVFLFSVALLGVLFWLRRRQRAA